MKKEIIVDKSMCIGCGACMGLDPEHFEINDEGVSEVISNENLETEELQNAIEGCPVQIIKIEEKNDEGVSKVISNENLKTEELQNAIEDCPVQNIKVEEKNENEKVQE